MKSLFKEFLVIFKKNSDCKGSIYLSGYAYCNNGTKRPILKIYFSFHITDKTEAYNKL